MLSIDSALSVPGFSTKEIGYFTLVRGKRANFEIQITNDSNSHVSKLNVKITLESYIGQIKPMLFKQDDPQVIDSIPPKGMVPLTFELYPTFGGLIATAIHITDSLNKNIMIKRITDGSYKESPLRWWWNVADDISVETLRTLKQLVKQGSRGAKK